jgi:outer membrane usher protein FimD/PapC
MHPTHPTRQILAILLAALLAAPAVPARDAHDWANVKKLNPGTPVRVLLWSGESLGGELDAVSDSTLRLSVADRSAPQTGWSRTLDRASIHRVSRARHNDPPNPKRWLIGGTVAGGAAGIAVGAAQDANRGTTGRWLLGGFAGAVLGFLAAVAAVGTVAIVKTARNASQVRVIYEDGGAPPPSS